MSRDARRSNVYVTVAADACLYLNAFSIGLGYRSLNCLKTRADDAAFSRAWNRVRDSAAGEALYVDAGGSIAAGSKNADRGSALLDVDKGEIAVRSEDHRRHFIVF